MKYPLNKYKFLKKKTNRNNLKSKRKYYTMLLTGSFLQLKRCSNLSKCLSFLSQSQRQKFKRFFSNTRNWIQLVNEKDSGSQFRLMSYNLLAPAYVRPEMYPFTAPGDMDWMTRKKRIVE